MIETILNSGFFWGLLGLATIIAMVEISNRSEKKHTAAHN
jgi:hypothetical protein